MCTKLFLEPVKRLAKKKSERQFKISLQPVFGLIFPLNNFEAGKTISRSHDSVSEPQKIKTLFLKPNFLRTKLFFSARGSTFDYNCRNSGMEK